MKIIFILMMYTISDLPYHAHGFDEIKLIKQQIIKGVRSFKIDVSFGALEIC